MCSVQFYSSFCRWSAWNWPFPFSVSKVVQQIKMSLNFLFTLCISSAPKIPLNTGRPSIRSFKFLVIVNNIAYFFTFTAILWRKKHHVLRILYWNTGTILYVLPYETFDFKSWCRCGICSVQFHSSFCSKWNQQQTTFFVFFDANMQCGSASWI